MPVNICRWETHPTEGHKRVREYCPLPGQNEDLRRAAPSAGCFPQNPAPHAFHKAQPRRCWHAFVLGLAPQALCFPIPQSFTGPQDEDPRGRWERTSISVSPASAINWEEVRLPTPSGQTARTQLSARSVRSLMAADTVPKVTSEGATLQRCTPVAATTGAAIAAAAPVLSEFSDAVLAPIGCPSLITSPSSPTAVQARDLRALCTRSEAELMILLRRSCQSLSCPPVSCSSSHVCTHPSRG